MADPEGPRFAEYFREQDNRKAETIAVLEKKIKQLDEAIQGEPNRARQGVLRGEKNRTVERLSDTRKQTYYPQLAPGRPGVHSIGHLPFSQSPKVKTKVVAIIDGKRAVVEFSNVVSVTNIVLIDIDTSEFKLRQPITNNQVWHVVQSPVSDKMVLETLKKDNPYDALNSSAGHYMVEPIDIKTLQAERARYDAQQALKRDDVAK